MEPKFTPENVEEICDNIELGMPLSYAAEAVGVSRQTVWEWRDKYPEFGRRLTRARASGLKVYLELAKSGGKGSSFAIWYMERQFRADFGDVRGVELTGKDGGPIQLEPIAQKLDKLTVEELKALASDDPTGA